MSVGSFWHTCAMKEADERAGGRVIASARETGGARQRAAGRRWEDLFPTIGRRDRRLIIAIQCF